MAQDDSVNIWNKPLVFKGCWSNSHTPSSYSPIEENDVYIYNDYKQPYFLPDIRIGSLLISRKKIITKKDKVDLINWIIITPEGKVLQYKNK